MKNPKNLASRNEDSSKHLASLTERLLSRRDVASLLSVHPETVKRMGKRGELTEIVIRRNLIRYKPAQVATLIRGIG